MSKRNKLENKNIRRGIRLGMNRPNRVNVGAALAEDFDRLTDPKAKLGSPIRKMLMRARGSILDMSESKAPTLRDKAIARLRRNSYNQLCHRVHQYWARAAGAHNRAEKLVAGSRFAAALNRLETVNLVLFSLAQEEIKRRSEKVIVLS